MAVSAVLGVLVCLLMLRIPMVQAVHTLSTESFSQTCIDEFLVTTENKSAGVEVSIFAKDSDGNRPYQMLTKELISYHFLSSECGVNNFRCQNLLVIPSELNATTTQYIVFVPLVDGLLLLDLTYNGVWLSFTGYHVIDIQNIGCSPVTSFQILRSAYTVCLGLRTQYLTILEVVLNTTSLSNTRITGPLIRFHGLEDPPRVTDFEYIPLQQYSLYQVYFSTSRYLYALDPLSYLAHDIGELASCDSVTSLAYAKDETLIAYCSDNSAVYFDLTLQDWINQTAYSERGQPFICPNPDIHLAVYPTSYIQYGLWSQNTLENFNIPGLEFDSGICFGTQNKTFFAYNDREDGVYVLEPATFHQIQLSSESCLNQCDPLLVFDNRYLVLREHSQNDATAIVVDSKKNFSRIITAQHTQADLLTVLVATGNRISCSIAATPLLPSPTGPILPPSFSVASTAATIVAIVLLIVLSSVVIAIAVVVHRNLRSRSTRTPTPSPESGVDSSINIHIPHRDMDQASSRDNHSEEDTVPTIHPRESSTEAPNKNVVNLKGANGVGSSDVMPVGIYTTGPAYQKLLGVNQVYTSVAVCEGDVDCNLALAKENAEQDVSACREEHGKDLRDSPADSKALQSNSLMLTVQEKSANSVKSFVGNEGSGYEGPPVLPAETNTGGSGACAKAQFPNQKSDASPPALQLTLSHSGSTISTSSYHSESSHDTCTTQGNESGDELEQSLEIEADSDREWHSDDHLIPGTTSPVPKLKVLHAVRNKHKIRRRWDEPQNTDYQNLNTQIAQDNLN